MDEENFKSTIVPSDLVSGIFYVGKMCTFWCLEYKEISKWVDFSYFEAYPGAGLLKTYFRGKAK